MAAVHYARIELKVPLAAPLSCEATVLADIWGPDTPAERSSTVLFCQPGGGMNRQYFDIRSVDGTGGFSFAEQMAAFGFTVVLLDHPGLGEAGAGLDVFELTASLLARSSQSAIGQVVARLGKGDLCPGQGPLTGIRSVAVAHSMGAMVAIIRQAQFDLHDGLVLLGFSTRGLPEFVPEPLCKALANQGMPDDAQIVEWARRQFGAQRTRSTSDNRDSAALFGARHADREGLLAMKSARDRMLPAAAMQAMLPGNVAAEARQIHVPVLAAVGEFDMTGPVEEISDAFACAQNFQLRVGKDAGHCHFVFPDRQALFLAIRDWADQIAQTDDEQGRDDCHASLPEPNVPRN